MVKELSNGRLAMLATISPLGIIFFIFVYIKP